LIEELPHVPESYLKHLTGTDGLYEIRVQEEEINRAIKLKKEYYEEKKQSKKS
jgi:hypothetical protein